MHVHIDEPREDPLAMQVNGLLAGGLGATVAEVMGAALADCLDPAV
jgi:hypothetical protein